MEKKNFNKFKRLSGLKKKKPNCILIFTNDLIFIVNVRVTLSINNDDDNNGENDI